jgi:hypothetical protein
VFCWGAPQQGMYSTIPIGGLVTLKMLRRKSKTQFVKQECNTQNAIVLLNYFKLIAPQQLMLRMQVFIKNLKQKDCNRNFIKYDFLVK